MKKTNPTYLDDVSEELPPLVDPSAAEKLYAKRKSAADEIAAIDAKAHAEGLEAFAAKAQLDEEFAKALEDLKQLGNRRTAAQHRITAITWRADRDRSRPLTFLQKTADGSISALHELVREACGKSELPGTYEQRTALRQRQLAARDKIKNLWMEALTADELADRLATIAQEAGVNW
jgi:hypothetical protein